MDQTNTIEKLSPKPGDILVLKVPMNHPQNEVERMANILRDNLDEAGHKSVLVAVITATDELSLLDEGVMLKYGWAKKREYKGREFL